MNELTNQLSTMTDFVCSAFSRSHQALLSTNLALAESVIAQSDSLAEQVRKNEELAFTLLALQAPVAGDLRRIVTSIQMVADIRRMGVLSHHIAATVRRRHPREVLPDAIKPQFEEMAAVALEIATGAKDTLLSKDIAKAAQLAETDHRIDALHRELFQLTCTENWPYPTVTAVDITLLGRFYERFADHGVMLAQRVVFLATGKNLNLENVTESVKQEIADYLGDE